MKKTIKGLSLIKTEMIRGISEIIQKRNMQKGRRELLKLGDHLVQDLGIDCNGWSSRCC